MPTSPEQIRKPRSGKLSLAKYPPWSPRFWHGMRTTDWLRLLARNRFRIHPIRLGLTFTVTSVTLINSTLSVFQKLLYNRKVAQTEITEAPIFIIGHWRSGTTYLHELLVRDERFAFPTTYECYAPHHFLISGGWMPKLIGFLLPRTRPMDNMLAGFDHPQEDEFALSNLGCPTPYWRMVFPNEPPCYMELLDMQGVAPELLVRWKRDMLWFVQALTFHKRKRLILKSPPHTGRVQTLTELFPDARFIHITRHPETLFASTRRLWPLLDAAQALQLPRNEHLDEYVFAAFERMYRGFESQRRALASNRICDVRYEDLVRDPVPEMRRIYDRLELGDFETMQPKLEAFVATQRDYQATRHEELEPEIKAEIRRRWGAYASKYGYPDCC